MEDLQQIKNSFMQELNLASTGEPSSVSFLLTKLPDTKVDIGEEPYEVLVVGGSNYQQAICQRHKNMVRVLSKKSGQIPTFDTKETFFAFVEQLLDPEIKTLVINFAFPMSSVVRQERLDGTLIQGTKGHTFAGLVGQLVGEVTELYFLEKFGRKLSVHVANDTICLLLSGLTIGKASDLACVIVGTGYNTAFFVDERKLVNTEAGNFDKFVISDSARFVDEKSAHPGVRFFEKEVAGAYLHQSFQYWAEREGLSGYSVNSAEDVSRIAPEDGTAGRIAREILARSARLVAVQIAGITETKKTDTIFVVEGSLFWKAHQYKEQVEQYVRELTQYSIEFVKIEDSEIIGAGVLV